MEEKTHYRVSSAGSFVGRRLRAKLIIITGVGTAVGRFGVGVRYAGALRFAWMQGVLTYTSLCRLPFERQTALTRWIQPVQPSCSPGLYHPGEELAYFTIVQERDEKQHEKEVYSTRWQESNESKLSPSLRPAELCWARHSFPQAGKRG